MKRLLNIVNPLVVLIAMFFAGTAGGQDFQPPILPSTIHTTAVGATASGNSQLPRVILLVFERNDENVLKIVENLQLRMFDVDVKFGIRWVKPIISDYDSQVEMAHSIIDAEHLQLVFFWNSDRRDTLYYLSPDQDTPLTRTIDDVGKESRPEAIALVVQTAVESLLSLDEPPIANEADDPNSIANNADEGVKPEPSQQTPETKTASESSRTAGKHPSRTKSIRENKKRQPQRFFFQTGYELNLVNNAPTFLQGGNIRLGLELIPSVCAFVGVGATGYLKSEEQDFSMTQFRIPIEIGGMGLFSKSAWRFGVGASFLFVPLRNAPDTSHPPEVDDLELRGSFWSQTMMLKAFTELRYHFSKRIAVFIDFHLLIDTNMVSYPIKTYPEDVGPVLFDEFHRLWPGFQVGMAFFTF